MNIQLYFDTPLLVSVNPVSKPRLTLKIPDKLRITFNDIGMWTGVNTKYMEKKSQVLTRNIPRQTWLYPPPVPRLSAGA